MEAVIVQLIVGLAQTVPAMVAAIQGSATLSPDEKKALIEKLKGELDAQVAAVAAVKFQEV